MVELSRYLAGEYPDELLDCTICSSVRVALLPFHLIADTDRITQVVTRGISCTTPNCKARMHGQCLTRYRDTKSRQGVAFACPTCGESWQGEAKTRPVGEAAFREGQDKQRRRTRRADGDEDGEDDDDDDDEEDEDVSMSQQTQEPSQSQSQSQPRSQRSRKGKGRAVVSDEDEDPEEEAVKPAKRKGRQ